MSERILCVDDDPNILQAYHRALRKQFDLETALGAEEALTAIAERGPFAVVVADMRMPGISGVHLLMRVQELAPDTVRMMLTGNADQQTAVDAVNDGHVFRFMTKPCPPEKFAKALEAGLEQYRLVSAERELLTQTLRGAIRVLTDVLTLVSPEAFGRASRVCRLVRLLCGELGIQKTWQMEIAAMLCQLGCITVPEKILHKVHQGHELTPAEAEIYQGHPRTGRDLIANIPRLEEVAEIIAYQEKLFDGRGFPADYRSGKKIPLGSRVLKLALDWDILVSTGLTPEMALAEINDRQGWYDPGMVGALRKVLNITEAHIIRRCRISDLVDGVILADDVVSTHGTLLCSKGQEVTSAIRLRLRNYAINVGIARPVKIFVPVALAYGMEDGQEIPEESFGTALEN
jgi:response regulator RpfG family c-di-GMP phosphodiesterase